MSWQAFTWTEIPARPGGHYPAAAWNDSRVSGVLSFAAGFLGPFAVMEAALGLWRLGADLGWTGAFFVNGGVFSHWQVWIAMSLFTQAAAVYLNRLLSAKADSGENRA